jgi:hypothetical protein
MPAPFLPYESPTSPGCGRPGRALRQWLAAGESRETMENSSGGNGEGDHHEPQV